MTFDEICLLDDDVLFSSNTHEQNGLFFYFDNSEMFSENEKGLVMRYKPSIEDISDKSWHKV